MFQAKCGSNESESDCSLVGFVDAAPYGEVPTIGAGPTSEGRKEDYLLIALEVGDFCMSILGVGAETKEGNE
jgi:hypothetical protein